MLSSLDTILRVSEKEQLGPTIDYRYYWDLLRRGKWTILATTLLGLGLALVSGLLRTPLYQAQATVSVELPPPSIDPLQAVMTPQYNSYFDYEYYFQTQLRILSGSTLALQTAEALRRLPQYRDRSREELAAEIQASVVPRQVENTRIIQIAVTRESPEEAALWANTLAEVYVESNLQERKKSFQETLAALKSLLEKAEANQAQVIERLRRAFSEFGFIPSEGAGGRLDTSALDAATENLLRAQQERRQAEARYQQAWAARATPARVASLLAGPHELNALLQRKAALEQELRELSEKGFLAEHPRVRERRMQLDALQDQIARATEAALQELQNEVEIARRREEEARRAREREQQRVQGASTNPQLLDQILQQAVASEITRELKQTLNRVELSGQLLRNNVALVDRARPPRAPLNRQSPRVLLLGLFGGMFLGVGIVVAKDFVDNTIRDSEEVERLLGLPVLGEIPRFADVEEFARREAFHAIWTNLKLAHRGGASRAVLITSSVMEEGKTTVACELARTMAILGARTLLVDLDLRRPDVHRRFPSLQRAGEPLGAVLVVDDEDAVREMVARGLSACGLVAPGNGGELGPLLLAKDAQAALERIRENDVAVAIVDIKLPGISGVELLGKIKELSPHTEVVMVTGYASLETAIEAIRKGAADYLLKPFGIEALREAVDRAVQRRRQHAVASPLSRSSEAQGIVAYLMGEVELSALICRTDLPNLHVIPAGHPPQNPFLLLDRTVLQEMVGSLKEQFQWIIFDSPPITAVSDPAVIAPVVDGILIVVRFNRTDRKVVRRAVRSLARASEHIWGIVLNDIRMADVRYGSYYSYSYRPRESESPRKPFWRKIAVIRRERVLS